MLCSEAGLRVRRCECEQRGSTALYLAAENGRVAMVQLLLGNKADVNRANAVSVENPMADRNGLPAVESDSNTTDPVLLIDEGRVLCRTGRRRYS